MYCLTGQSEVLELYIQGRVVQNIMAGIQNIQEKYSMMESERLNLHHSWGGGRVEDWLSLQL